VSKIGLKDDGSGVLLRKFKHGQSNPTYYLKFGGKEMVLRKKPVSTYFHYTLLSLIIQHNLTSIN